MTGRRNFRERKSKKGSWIYIVLAIVLVFVMAKWGIAAFIDILAGPTNSKSSRQTQIEDRIPPQTPLLSALPDATNSANLKVEGFTQAEVDVGLIINDIKVGTAVADKDGAFSFKVNLKEGDNSIVANASDKSGSTSHSIAKTVILDTKSPEIKIDSPKDGSEFFGSKNQNVTISGKISESGVSLNLNNAFVRVGSDGTFSISFRLAEGDNTLTLSSTDEAGNTAQASLKLKLTL